MQTTRSGWHGAKKSASEDCARPITDGIITHLDFDTVVVYHWIRQINSDKFCYLGYIMWDAYGGYDSADMARVRSAWK